MIVALVAVWWFVWWNMMSKTNYTTEAQKEIQINKTKISENDIFLKVNCQPLMLENQKLKDRNGILSDSIGKLNPKTYICYNIKLKEWTGDAYTKYADEYSWVEWCEVWKTKWCYANSNYNCVEKSS